MEMESHSTGTCAGRAVNWSFPMNNPTHLPPRSPAFSTFDSSLWESNANAEAFDVRSSYPMRSGGHRRTPSAGYLPPMQPSWLEEVFETPELRKGSHRRASSDSLAFLESPRTFSRIDDNIAEEGEFEVRSAALLRRAGCSSTNFDRLDEEQLMCMFADIEPFSRPANQAAEVTATRATAPTNVMRASNTSNSWRSERGMKHLPTKVVPSSLKDVWKSENAKTQVLNLVTLQNQSKVCDSNSHSEVSSDDFRAGGLERYKSEPEVQSISEGDHSLHQGDGATSFTEIDSSLDPRKAKRILANRQSAQRSRVRKLQYISELEVSVNALQTEVSTLTPQVAFYEHRRALLNAENIALKQKLSALTQGQCLKEARNDATKEVQKLLLSYPQQQHLQAASSYELQQQQFSELNLGPLQSMLISGVPNAYAGGLVKISPGLSHHGNGALQQGHPKTNGNLKGPLHAHGVKTLVPSSSIAPGSARKLQGRMIGEGRTHPLDSMVKNT